MVYIRRGVFVAAISFWLWFVYVYAPSESEAAEPPTPREVATALAVRVDAMLVNVYSIPIRVSQERNGVYCRQRLGAGGRRYRSAGCTIRFQGDAYNPVEVWGTLRRGICPVITDWEMQHPQVVYEDFSGRIWVRHRGNIWCYDFGPTEW